MGESRRRLRPRARIRHELPEAPVLLGAGRAAGEVLGHVRKHTFMGHSLDRDALASELGDALWCLSSCALALGLSLEEVAGANLAKLRSRYPDGYSDNRSRTGREPGDR